MKRRKCAPRQDPLIIFTEYTQTLHGTAEKRPGVVDWGSGAAVLWQSHGVFGIDDYSKKVNLPALGPPEFDPQSYYYASTRLKNRF